jgi:ketosteroid isomerase-like protein
VDRSALWKTLFVATPSNASSWPCRKTAVALAVFLIPLLSACTNARPVETLQSEREVIEEIDGLIEAQVAAWNSGDLEGFTSVYSEDCKFLSPSGLTEGRAQVLARYRRRYPDRAAMGTLRFEFIEMVPASMEVESVFGLVKSTGIFGVSVAATWFLSYPDRDTASGLTLIIFRRTPKGWRIIQDASMSFETDQE